MKYHILMNEQKNVHLNEMLFYLMKAIWKRGSVNRIKDGGSDWGIGESSTNSNRVRYIHLRANKLGER